MKTVAFHIAVNAMEFKKKQPESTHGSNVAFRTHLAPISGNPICWMFLRSTMNIWEKDTFTLVNLSRVVARDKSRLEFGGWHLI